MKKTFKIIGLLVSFVGFMALGYFMPMSVYESVIQMHNNVAVNNTEAISKSKIIQPEESVAQTVIETTQKTIEVAEIVADTLTPDTAVESVVGSVVKASGIPQNINVIVGGRNSKNYKRIGYPLTVSAEVESGDELECLIKMSEDAVDVVAKAIFADGKAVFRDVPPVDGGAYYICVRNIVSGESAGVYKNGFNKIAKLSKEELTQQLNSDNLDKYFYFHFDMDKVKFDCEGIAEGEKPSTIERLRVGRSAFGWTITVIETPKYDKYNRIVYFKIQIAS